MRRPERLGLLGVFLSLLWLPPLVSSAPPGDLGELMAQLGKVRSVHARYSEEVQASLLQHNITSTGTIRYLAPDTIVKSTDTEPSREIRIEGDRISINEAGMTREIHISEHRAIESMVSALRAVFAGDPGDLERHFRLRFEPLSFEENDEGWRLTLSPHDSEVSWLLSHIEIQGIGREIRRIEIQEPNGDSRRMYLERLSIDPPDE